MVIPEPSEGPVQPLLLELTAKQYPCRIVGSQSETLNMAQKLFLNRSSRDPDGDPRSVLLSHLSEITWLEAVKLRAAKFMEHEERAQTRDAQLELRSIRTELISLVREKVASHLRLNHPFQLLRQE